MESQTSFKALAHKYRNSVFARCEQAQDRRAHFEIIGGIGPPYKYLTHHPFLQLRYSPPLLPRYCTRSSTNSRTSSNFFVHHLVLDTPVIVPSADPHPTLHNVVFLWRPYLFIFDYCRTHIIIALPFIPHVHQHCSQSLSRTTNTVPALFCGGENSQPYRFGYFTVIYPTGT